jgi:hypothetical protein
VILIRQQYQHLDAHQALTTLMVQAFTILIVQALTILMVQSLIPLFTA